METLDVDNSLIVVTDDYIIDSVYNYRLDCENHSSKINIAQWVHNHSIVTDLIINRDTIINTNTNKIKNIVVLDFEKMNNEIYYNLTLNQNFKCNVIGISIRHKTYLNSIFKNIKLKESSEVTLDQMATNISLQYNIELVECYKYINMIINNKLFYVNGYSELKKLIGDNLITRDYYDGNGY